MWEFCPALAMPVISCSSVWISLWTMYFLPSLLKKICWRAVSISRPLSFRNNRVWNRFKNEKKTGLISWKIEPLSFCSVQELNVTFVVSTDVASEPMKSHSNRSWIMTIDHPPSWAPAPDPFLYLFQSTGDLFNRVDSKTFIRPFTQVCTTREEGVLSGKSKSSRWPGKRAWRATDLSGSST